MKHEQYILITSNHAEFKSPVVKTLTPVQANIFRTYKRRTNKLRTLGNAELEKLAKHQVLVPLKQISDQIEKERQTLIVSGLLSDYDKGTPWTCVTSEVAKKIAMGILAKLQ